MVTTVELAFKSLYKHVEESRRKLDDLEAAINVLRNTMTKPLFTPPPKNSTTPSAKCIGRPLSGFKEGLKENIKKIVLEIGEESFITSTIINQLLIDRSMVIVGKTPRTYISLILKDLSYKGGLAIAKPVKPGKVIHYKLVDRALIY